MTRKQTVSHIPPDEVTLVQRAATRDPDAIASLYDLYAPRIYSYVYHRVSDPVLAEDLTGQVFLRMLEALEADKAWRTSFSGWLYRIAHNLIVDQYRKRSRAEFSNIDDAPHLPASGNDPFQVAAARLDSDALIRAINLLTEEQAQVVTLRFLEGYSIAEVAKALDKSEGAIKALQYRAIASLRRIMSSQAHFS